MATVQSIQSEFLHSVKLGTGRAYLLAKAHPEVDFSAAIIKAALRNFAYDGQAEGSRAQYVYDLYCLSSRPAAIRRAVLQELAREQEDTWALNQLFELALFFAKEGDATARKTLYKQFLRKPAARADWLGAYELIALDGLVGLIFIARKYGQALAKDPNDWQDDDIIESFQKEHPAGDAWAELRQVAEQDADVHRYLQNVEATMAQQAAYEQPAVSTDLEVALQEPHQRHLFLRLMRNQETFDLQPLAERLLTEKNMNVRENLLFIFTLHPYPLDYHPILTIARQKPSRRNRITEYAVEALKHLQAPEIREFALQRLASTTQPALYTDILVSNYQPGDAALLTAVVARFHAAHIIESLAVSYIEIYRANPTPECAAPLLALYQKMTCSIHRTDVVELLIANNVLPPWLNDELPFDSNAATRLLHQPH
ncbi:MAG: hypothetical protein ACRYFX_28540 [Janthinobacterium lividum]